MFDCDQWLNEDVEGRPRHERLCFLVAANGGFDVHEWGCLSYGNGHQRGLEQNDAINLIMYNGFMRGLDAAGIPVYDAFRPYWDKYMIRFGVEDELARSEE